jgi:GTP-binding protein Era
MIQKPDLHHNQKTLSVCIIGKPNAGKSSLLNRIIGQKISIVTPKVQTTRSIITGITTIKDTQLILFDTPGIFEPRLKLEKAMVRCAWSSLSSADIVALIVDSTKKLDDMTIKIMDRILSLKIDVVFLLNKIDLKSNIDEHAQYLKEKFKDPKIFKISATKGTGIDNLMNHFMEKAIPSPWVYEEDDITTAPMRFLASEITRERLFLNLQEELPYNLTVETEMWQDNPDGSVKINQVIVVSKENYKMIILGKGGSKIKEIGLKSRLEMEKSFERRVHLFLFVKVREWENSPEYYSYMGLKLNKRD